MKYPVYTCHVFRYEKLHYYMNTFFFSDEQHSTRWKNITALHKTNVQNSKSCSTCQEEIRRRLNVTITKTKITMDLVNGTACSNYGPKRDELYVVIPITVIYVVIFITGTVGNVTTCIVIHRNKSLHTATNYYLFSLAVSDLVLLVSGLPQEIYLIWNR